MCGFAGIVARPGRSVSPEVLASMGATIRHRGPDDDGSWRDERVGLTFRRLSILDLSPAGHQPMESDDGRFILVFNGEIYNFAELRAELAGLGHRFRSQGDSEVLLHAYMQWGRECVARLNGMWAFLVYDRAAGVVFGSRDRFGVKPLYRAEADGQILVASEIKALRAAGAGREPDWSRVADWLASGPIDQSIADGRTFFAGITEIAPATAFEVTLDGTWREWTYWSLDAIERRPHPAPAEAFAELFDDAVRLQARADVPVGVSLSGGLDSTAIICALTRARGDAEPVNAFCFFSDEHDERRYIDATLEYTGARLHPVRVSPAGLFDVLGDVLHYHDEPVHSLSAVIGYEIMRAARASGIKVMLGGQGADETLAGYPSYFDDYWTSLVRRGAQDRAGGEIAEWAGVHGPRPDEVLARIVARARRWAWQSRVPGYLAVANARDLRRRRRHPWFTPDVMRRVAAPRPAAPDGLSDSLRLSVFGAPLPLYLRVDDRNSMAHGVEGRVPFLDHRLVELAFSLPEEWLLRGPWNKYVLRQAMRGRAPAVVHERADKMGFPHPRRRWFGEDLAEPIGDILSSGAFASRGIYDVARVRDDFARHRRGEADVSVELFATVQLERWLSNAPGPQPGRGPQPAPPSRVRVAASL
jgi:asparagine synthase (glutamine-hydrolysing)